jgi:hypothetical protein
MMVMTGFIYGEPETSLSSSQPLHSGRQFYEEMCLITPDRGCSGFGDWDAREICLRRVLSCYLGLSGASDGRKNGSSLEKHLIVLGRELAE